MWTTEADSLLGLIAAVHSFELEILQEIGCDCTAECCFLSSSSDDEAVDVNYFRGVRLENDHKGKALGVAK